MVHALAVCVAHACPNVQVCAYLMTRVQVTPSLMTFREVETLFHECGHALQHMLTQVDEGHVSGIRGVE